MGIDPQDETEEEFQNMLFDVKYDKEEFNDPETIGLLMYRLSKERKKTNELFKKITDKLDELHQEIGESKNSNKEKNTVANEETLSKVDKKVYNHVKDKGKVDAAEIQDALGYKGRNAASARLNSLYKKGFLEKERAGKRVLYWAKG